MSDPTESGARRRRSGLSAAEGGSIGGQRPMSYAVDDILDRLRAAGGRITSARRALVTALLDHDGHPSAEALAEAVQARQPDVHQTTIYRILDDLERLGIVEHTHLGHGPAVYHLSETAHPHVVCDRCGAVIQVDRKAFDALARTLLDDYDFVLQPGHFAVTGRCRRCVGELSPS